VHVEAEQLDAAAVGEVGCVSTTFLESLVWLRIV
jgi:hypothetical protein